MAANDAAARSQVAPAPAPPRLATARPLVPAGKATPPAARHDAAAARLAAAVGDAGERVAAARALQCDGGWDGERGEGEGR